MTNPPCRATVLGDVARALRREGVRLCVLHGSEDFPDRVDTDLDVVCPEPERIPRLLAANGPMLIQAIEHERNAFYYVLYGSCDEGAAFVALDVSADYRRNGRVFFTAAELLASCRDAGDIDRPAADVEFTCYLIKRVLKGDLHSDHVEKLSRRYMVDPAACRRQLARFFSEDHVGRIADAAASGDWTFVRGGVRALRRDLLRRSMRRDPWGVLRYWAADVARMVRRIRRPTGLLVVLDGPEPRRIAEIIDRVADHLAPGFRRTVTHHGRSSIDVYRWLVRSSLVLLTRPRSRSGRMALVNGRLPRPDLHVQINLRTARPPGTEPTADEQAGPDARLGSLAARRSHTLDGTRSDDEIADEVERLIITYLVERTAVRLGTDAQT